MADAIKVPTVKAGGKVTADKVGRGIRAILAGLKDAKGTWTDGRDATTGKVTKEAGSRTVAALKYLAVKLDEVAEDAATLAK